MDASSPHFSLSFSPSKARAQRAQAADWQQVDSWLSSKYQGRSVPAFERNDETLRVLLALVAANEKADEEREVLWTIEKKALSEAEMNLERDADNTAILDALKGHLSPEARQSLDALADTSVAVDASRAEPEVIAHALVDLTIQSQALTQQLTRLNQLQAHLQTHVAGMSAQLREIRPSKDAPNGFVVPKDLAQQTQEWTRNTKMLKPKLMEYEERLNALDRAAESEAVNFEEVVSLENELSDMKSRFQQLQGQVKAYEGLPPNKDAARKEVKVLEREVDALKKKRDRIFADMVAQ